MYILSYNLSSNFARQVITVYRCENLAKIAKWLSQSHTASKRKSFTSGLAPWKALSPVLHILPKLSSGFPCCRLAWLSPLQLNWRSLFFCDPLNLIPTVTKGLPPLSHTYLFTWTLRVLREGSRSYYFLNLPQYVTPSPTANTLKW